MSPQRTIGHYRITAKLGQGGMGEVYRATDTKLGRDVALKILPASLAQDPERMARFEREAKVLASLNHPNIAQIYGVEDCALVMELVEGEAPRGPLPLDTALDYARQIADALGAAHEKGIVHRDLKPGNIVVTGPASGRPGLVKVLDFGLARVAEESGGDTQDSPTVTISPTRAGVILGTAGYMSPEQARGRLVDKRADIWAFGCVLYEMLTGETAFPGETTTDVLAGVLDKDPDLTRVPAKVRRVLRRCLEKDPRKRLRDIGDVWEPLDTSEQPAASKIRWPWIAAAAAIIAAVAASWIAWREARPVEYPLMRVSVDLGPEAMVGLSTTVAISPDGRRIVYPARAPDGRQQLAMRLLDQDKPVLLPGTEGGADAFFSPDGRWIGFFSGQVKRILVQGGSTVTLGTPSDTGYGASWFNEDGLIAALGSGLPLSRVPLAGGSSQVVTRLNAGDFSHRWPQVLPGGRAVLLSASSNGTAWDSGNIEAADLKDGVPRVVQRGGFYGRFFPGGFLVYVCQGTLFAVKFDPDRLKVTGTPVPMLQDVAANAATGGGQFSFSPGPSGHGIFLYMSGTYAPGAWTVNWLDGSGGMQPLLTALSAYSLPRLSPDGRKLAFVKGGDVFVADSVGDTVTRLTFTGGANVPVWAPDGNHIAFGLGGNAGRIVWIRSNGAGEARTLLEGVANPIAYSFAPDGRLAFAQRNPGYSVWTLPLDLSDPDRPKPGTPEISWGPPGGVVPRFSPDGRWIAYRSSESGTEEIYVRPFPASRGGKWQISSGGGIYGIWSKNGHELFYETQDRRIMVLDYKVEGDSFIPGKPRVWYDKPLFYTGSTNIDLAPDGKRFVVLALPETAPGDKRTVHVTMLLNFLDELKRRIP
jgi:serine/threonine-protein kinase